MSVLDGAVQVAWIKADAKAILAIHEHVITNSDRLSVTHNDFNTWTLVIRNVRMEDRGQYMCQVSQSIKLNLRRTFTLFTPHSTLWADSFQTCLC